MTRDRPPNFFSIIEVSIDHTIDNKKTAMGNNEKKKNRRSNKNKNRKRKQHPVVAEYKGGGGDSSSVGDSSSDDDDGEGLLAAAQAWAKNDNVDANNKSNKSNNKKENSNNPHQQQEHYLPPPFPSHLPFPKDDFLRNSNDRLGGESFNTALDTTYEGLAWDTAADLQQHVNLREASIRRSLLLLDQVGFFREDMTQPAGLGTRCAKTYVTRCLLGECGTTYKYLGLRMFSYPWNSTSSESSSEEDASITTNEKKKKVQDAVRNIYQLNSTLEERTSCHLQSLSDKRKGRGRAQGVKGTRGKFDITLINKMTLHPRLKPEPMFSNSKNAQNKCTVSWHSDSSLEHYSTIAVYQALVQEGEGASTPAPASSSSSSSDWSVAMRTTINAEGPSSKRLGEIKVDNDVPAIQVSLPSGSAYYLLDDFNHHHQHAVLAPQPQPRNYQQSKPKPITRFSSTHRLLRKGHNVSDMLDRCKAACGQFHKKSIKKLRGEQLLLNELESEWLRQFFVQGRDHKELLWGAYWEKPLRELFRYWESLESRTRQVLLMLQHAAEERCGCFCSSISVGTADTSRSDKKLKEKRKKALAAVHEIAGDVVHRKQLYTSMAGLLRDRSKIRSLWKQRERDPAFLKVPDSARPLPFPVAYASAAAGGRKILLLFWRGRLFPVPPTTWMTLQPVSTHGAAATSPKMLPRYPTRVQAS